MNDVIAAIALKQYMKLFMYMEKRKHVNDFYDSELKDLEWIDLPVPISEGCKTSYYFYHIQVKNDKRDALAKYLRENNFIQLTVISLCTEYLDIM